MSSLLSEGNMNDSWSCAAALRIICITIPVVALSLSPNLVAFCYCPTWWKVPYMHRLLLKKQNKTIKQETPLMLIAETLSVSLFPLCKL
jgi:hypothetical protein